MRRLLVFIIAVLGGLAAPVAASAHPLQAYPPEPSVSVSSGSVVVGGSVTFSGQFAANEEVTVSVTYNDTGGAGGGGPVAAGGGGGSAAFRLASVVRPLAKTVGVVVADGSGAWSIVVQLTQDGIATLTATGPESGSLSAEVTVIGETNDDLATTGMDGTRLRNLVLTGVGTAVLGVLLVVFTIRRRRRVTTDA